MKNKSKLRNQDANLTQIYLQKLKMDQESENIFHKKAHLDRFSENAAFYYLKGALESVGLRSNISLDDMRWKLVNLGAYSDIDPIEDAYVLEAKVSIVLLPSDLEKIKKEVK